MEHGTAAQGDSSGAIPYESKCDFYHPAVVFADIFPNKLESQVHTKGHSSFFL